MEYGSTENWQRGAVPMRKELEDKLAHRWPSWFNLGGDPMSSATARGFECGGGGGFQLVWQLRAEMEPLVAGVG